MRIDSFGASAVRLTAGALLALSSLAPARAQQQVIEAYIQNGPICVTVVSTGGVESNTTTTGPCPNDPGTVVAKVSAFDLGTSKEESFETRGSAIRPEGALGTPGAAAVATSRGMAKVEEIYEFPHGGTVVYVAALTLRKQVVTFGIKREALGLAADGGKKVTEIELEQKAAETSYYLLRTLDEGALAQARNRAERAGVARVAAYVRAFIADGVAPPLDPSFKLTGADKFQTLLAGDRAKILALFDEARAVVDKQLPGNSAFTPAEAEQIQALTSALGVATGKIAALAITLSERDATIATLSATKVAQEASIGTLTSARDACYVALVAAGGGGDDSATVAELESIKAQLAGQRSLLVSLAQEVAKNDAARALAQNEVAQQLARVELKGASTSAVVHQIALHVHDPRIRNAPIRPVETEEDLVVVPSSAPVGAEIEIIEATMLAVLADAEAILACVDTSRLTDPEDLAEYYDLVAEGAAQRQEVLARGWTGDQCGGASVAEVMAHKVTYWEYIESKKQRDAAWLNND